MGVLSAKFDVVIIGGGPAGMSAALWCADTGLSVILIERENDLGGQLGLIHNPIKNYIGLEAANGREIKEKFLRSLEGLNIVRSVGVAVENLDLEFKIATLSDGRTFAGKSLILATGVRRRRLGVSGETEFQGRGILSSGVGEKTTAIGKNVVIVGGGDAALENALLLSEVASQVTVVHRRNQFSARREFVDEAHRRPKIRLLTESYLTSIDGVEQLTSVKISSGSDDTESTIATDLLLIRIGVIPNTELFAGKLKLDERHYVLVDSQGATSVPGVFAVGDVAHPSSPTISTATGSAATAVKSILYSL